MDLQRSEVVLDLCLLDACKLAYMDHIMIIYCFEPAVYSTYYILFLIISNTTI